MARFHRWAKEKSAVYFFFQAEDGIRDYKVTGVQTCALPISEEFAIVYNAAWAQHGEAKEITKEQVMKLFNKMKPIMDERLIWFAYYKNEPIADRKSVV